MEVPYEETRDEYMKMLDGRIGPLLQGCEKLRAMLVDELGMDRFVPKEWTSIVSFKPLDFHMRDDVSDAYKAKR